MAALACTGVVVLLTQPALQNFIEASGANIPTGDILTDYSYGLLWACLLALSILVWPVRGEDKIMLLLGWLTKCVVALGVMLPYEAHYPGLDCWTYFQGAHVHAAGIPSLIGAGGANLVIALGVIHLKIGPDSYQAMKISFSMIGLVAIYLFYRSAEVLLARRPARWAFWGLTLYPSVLFWSSILGKDPVVLLGIALHVWGLVNITVRRRHGYIVVALLGIGLASAIRVWMGPILLIPALVLLSIRIRSLGWRLTAVSVIVLALATLGLATIDRLGLDKAAGLVEATQIFDHGWDKANSSLQINAELTSVWDLILFTPESIFIAYFRPLPGDVPHLFGILAGCENSVLLALSLWAALRLRLRYFAKPFFLWAVTLLLTWGLAYGLVAYKDLGTEARFKLQIVPVMLGTIWFLISRRSSVQRSLAHP